MLCPTYGAQQCRQVGHEPFLAKSARQVKIGTFAQARARRSGELLSGRAV